MRGPRCWSGPRLRRASVRSLLLLALGWDVVVPDGFGDAAREVGQRAGPEPLEVRTHRSQTAGVHGVDAAGAERADVDELGRLEHLEVLGDRRPADGHGRGDLRDRARALA